MQARLLSLLKKIASYVSKKEMISQFNLISFQIQFMMQHTQMALDYPVEDYFSGLNYFDPAAN